MKKKLLLSIAMCFLMLLPIAKVISSTPEKDTMKDKNEINDKDKLVVVWTSGDKEVAMKMVFMYTFNAKKQGWWENVTLLVWGPSQKLLSEDKELQDYIKNMRDIGIEILACKACADQYEVSDKLTKIGVTVRYTGVDLTNFIRERHVITF